MSKRKTSLITQTIADVLILSHTCTCVGKWVYSSTLFFESAGINQLYFSFWIAFIKLTNCIPLFFETLRVIFFGGESAILKDSNLCIAFSPSFFFYPFLFSCFFLQRQRSDAEEGVQKCNFLQGEFFRWPARQVFLKSRTF